MNIKKILEGGLINRSELARRMWPNVKDATTKLQHKIAERDGRRLTENDIELIEKIFKKEFKS